MAASKSYFARANYRFLSSERNVVPVTSDFEFDESDVWNNNNAPSAERVSSSPENRRSKISKKPARDRNSTAARAVTAAASLPVNVPDWSKILKDEYRENRRRDSDDDDDDFNGGDDVDNRVPPHEFLARQLARTRIASFSVHEGIGRTLKGRDLSRVRNAIFEKTGFQD